MMPDEPACPDCTDNGDVRCEDGEEHIWEPHVDGGGWWERNGNCSCDCHDEA